MLVTNSVNWCWVISLWLMALGFGGWSIWRLLLHALPVASVKALLDPFSPLSPSSLSDRSLSARLQTLLTFSLEDTEHSATLAYSVPCYENRHEKTKILLAYSISIQVRLSRSIQAYAAASLFVKLGTVLLSTYNLSIYGSRNHSLR